MKEQVIEHINILFTSYNDLIEKVFEDILIKGIDIIKNKTLGEHLWCVIGARESYAKSIQKGEWAGFGCSLAEKDINNKAQVAEHLRSSAEDFEKVITKIEDWTEERKELLINLLEHETMHEGQIIRLMYGLEESLPKTWTDRWA